MQKKKRTRLQKIRLFVLFAALAVIIAGGAVYYGRVWYYERQLMQIAHEIIEEDNRQDPAPVGPEGPEADVSISVVCSFDHLVYGKKTGKIIMITMPRAHAADQRPVKLAYIYAHEDGIWREVESYSDCEFRNL